MACAPDWCLVSVDGFIDEHCGASGRSIKLPQVTCSELVIIHSFIRQ